MAELQFHSRKPDENLLTAIIIDDEQTMQVLLSKLLKQCDCKVVGRADNGKEGVKLFQTRKPDLVFLDINMPKQDGMETLEKIHEEDANATVCMVSADAYTDNVKKAVSLGVKGFIVKPLTIRRVEDFIARIRAERAASASTPEDAN